MEITVTRRYKGDKYLPSYTYAAGMIPTPPNTSAGYPQPAIFFFENTDHPIILNFDTLYLPTYGKHARFTLIIYEDAIESGDSENELVKYIEPRLIITNGVLTSVEYDLIGMGIVSGKIIINK